MTRQFDTGSLRASRMRLAGVGVVAVAALVALAPARADAGSMFVHSADSGKLAGGRLTLHGVGRNVTWTTTSGRVGVARITRAHKRLFLPKKPATGTLHIAGQRGGEELAFRLSKPRYSARRRTVSYRAKSLVKRTAEASAAAAAPRRFGAASLSVVPHSSLASGDRGHDCVTGLTNTTDYLLQASGGSKWDTDTWDWGFPTGAILGENDSQDWQSDGGLWRGCSNSATWTFVPGGFEPNPPSATFTVTTTYPWSDPWSNTCTSTNPQFTCQAYQNEAGLGSWWISRSQ
jgi:hypothetical protein